MSDKFTAVTVLGSSPGYAARGHVTREQAIEEAKRHYTRQLVLAEAFLEGIRKGEVRVFHQTGIWRVRNRKELPAVPTCLHGDHSLCGLQCIEAPCGGN